MDIYYIDSDLMWNKSHPQTKTSYIKNPIFNILLQILILSLHMCGKSFLLYLIYSS